MKGFIKLIIVIAVLGGIWFAWEQWKGNEAIQVDYQTEPLEKGDLMITIEATGVTEPDELVDVGAQVSGIIMEFGKDMNGKVVDYSSPVKAVRCSRKSTSFPCNWTFRGRKPPKRRPLPESPAPRRTSSRPKPSTSRPDWTGNARKSWGRGMPCPNPATTSILRMKKRLLQPPRPTVAGAEASLQEAEASLKQAEAALKKEMRNLEYTTIKSPVDGVVVKRLVNIGQTVVSSMSASSLFYIATDLSKLKIWAA